MRMDWWVSHVSTLLLCLLPALTSSGYTYEVRLWKSPIYGYGYGCSYKTGEGVFSAMERDGWEWVAATYAQAECASCACPLWIRNTSPYHFVSRCGPNNALGWVWKNEKLGAWLDNYYPDVTHTKTAALNWTLRKCKVCIGVPSSLLNEGAGFTPSTVTVNSDNVPFWAWASDKIENFQPIYNEQGTAVVGCSFDIKPSIKPPGAVEGENGNGQFEFDADTEPHWVWKPGMEPQLTADQMSEYLDGFGQQLTDLPAAIALEMSPYLADLQASQELQAGFVLDTLGDIYDRSHVDALSIVSAINGLELGGGASMPPDAQQDIADTAAATDQTAGNTAGMKNLLESIDANLASVKAQQDAMGGDVDLSDLDPGTDEEMQAVLDDAAARQVRDEGKIDTLNDLTGALAESYNFKVHDVGAFARATCGAWATLPRVPIEDVEWDFSVGQISVPFVIEFSRLDFMWAGLRAIEVVMLWVFFGYRVMGLFSVSVNAGKGES